MMCAGLPLLTHTISLARGVRHHSPCKHRCIQSSFCTPWRVCTGREHRGCKSGQHLARRSKAVDACCPSLNHAFFHSERLSYTLSLQLASCVQPCLKPGFRTSNFILTFPSLDCDERFKSKQIEKNNPKEGIMYTVHKDSRLIFIINWVCHLVTQQTILLELFSKINWCESKTGFWQCTVLQRLSVWTWYLQ